MVTKFMLLQYENIPCWYEISFDETTPAIIVKVHVDFLNFLPTFQDSHIITSYMENLRFSSFEANIVSGVSFGFDGAFKRIGQEGKFALFSVQIPVLETPQWIYCHHCQGNKQDLFGECSLCNGSGVEKKMRVCSYCNGDKEQWSGDDEDCWQCKGKGKQEDTIMNWHSFHAISATFSLFFNLMHFGQDASKMVYCTFPQLILVNAYIQTGMNSSAPLDGVYSIPLVNWMKDFSPNAEIRQVQNAMVKTWEKIYERFDDHDKMNTWARLNGGRLSLNCPGDRCGLCPSNFGIASQIDQGYEFCCHNLDSSPQQLTLLAGLAALCDKARKEIK